MVPLGPLPPAGRLARLTVLDIVPATLSFEQLARLQVEVRKLLAGGSACTGGGEGENPDV